jgi:thiol-disulfide isomerase/thioredoxin
MNWIMMSIVTSFIITGQIMISSLAGSNPFYDPSIIQGVIQLDDSIHINIGIYQNTLTELDPHFFFSWQKLNNEFEFQTSIEIDGPEMIEFYISDGRRLKFYITPGSFNKITISKTDFIFEGPTVKENNLLKELGLHKASIKGPQLGSNSILDTTLVRLESYYDSLYGSIDIHEFSTDFQKYISSDIFGYKYFWKYNLIFNFLKDTLGIDTQSNTLQKNIRSLFKFEFADESRSRYYNNAASYYYRLLLVQELSASDEDNLPLYIMASFLKNKEVFQNLPYVFDIINASIVNTAVFRAKSKSELQFAEYLYTYFSSNSKSANSFKNIKEELRLKKIRLNLNKIEDYQLLHSSGSQELISKYCSEGITIINFWASWCKPCLEKFPLLDSLSMIEKINLIHINLWSSKTSWSNLMTPNRIHTGIHLYADQSVSDSIAKSCSIVQFPMYFVVDSELNVTSIFDSFEALSDFITSLK